MAVAQTYSVRGAAIEVWGNSSRRLPIPQVQEQAKYVFIAPLPSFCDHIFGDCVATSQVTIPPDIS